MMTSESESGSNHSISFWKEWKEGGSEGRSAVQWRRRRTGYGLMHDQRLILQLCLLHHSTPSCCFERHAVPTGQASTTTTVEVGVNERPLHTHNVRTASYTEQTSPSRTHTQYSEMTHRQPTSLLLLSAHTNSLLPLSGGQSLKSPPSSSYPAPSPPPSLPPCLLPTRTCRIVGDFAPSCPSGSRACRYFAPCWPVAAETLMSFLG